MQLNTTIIRGIACAVMGAAVFAAGTAAADDFYKGKRLKLLIGNTPGGSYDIAARLVGRNFVRHIPGQPTLIVQNMRGGTGLIAANYVNNVGPKDGTMVANAHQSLPLRQVFGDKQVRYDARGFQWIGSPQSSVAMIATWHTSPIKTIQDAMKQESILGSTTIRASASIVPALTNSMLGTKFRLAMGYKSTEINLAMERGEVAGRAGQAWAGWKAEEPDWVRDGKLNYLIQVGLKKDPEIPQVPLLLDLAKGEKAKAIIKLYSAQISTGRPMYVVKEVPRDRVDILRAAFDKTMKDPKFLADAKKHHFEVKPTSGLELMEIVADMMNTPKQFLAEAKTAMRYSAPYDTCDKLSGKKACRKKKKRKKK
ncbi:MAG TPA: tripartite tricarboxylate transporter substrate-binding protein [Alphaproteobacteria bacterium]|nr:tripartite tricarboxylate transporter substrate-binding protein [Alphaproteobacteria bacterium]